ncbi:pyridoxal-dependent decarboxylase [Actinomadura sp. ATCC 31491]|uniref:Pyridoxal-dependent decarboxylase n=1 Tax=Actinomadura luzonensis TaxID=2805427 RepID=A0ABT0G0T1_9ACTN|nr:pyridoxal-dependent decarboxylase [Actinomadura luzonensis]MCK2218201.1 pyridoxal-dependent decarboxylase [Actinomadura luzonensis]
MDRPAPAWFAGSADGLRALDSLVDLVLATVRAGLADHDGPLPAGGPREVRRRSRPFSESILPDRGMGDAAALEPLARAFAAGSVDLTHPSTAAFLQCPALTVAAAADLVVSALNQSVDVWDSGPFAMELEEAVMAEIRDLLGLPEGAAGVTTPGGSLANLLAVIVARDVAGARLAGADIVDGGLAGVPGRLRVVCSGESHVSVRRAVAAAGLGDRSTIVVPADARGVMRAEAVERKLAGLTGDAAFLLIANAGTTDVGAIDELPRLARLAAARGMWFHVDAAYGGGMLMSRRLRPLFAGIELADSVTVDLHKMAWQPASASVLMLRRQADFAPLHREAPYLNPADDAEAGLPHRLGRTLETTRRADVLKIAAAFRALGRDGLSDLVDRCHELACYAAERIEADDRLQLAAPVTLTRVVFRYLPRHPARRDDVNAALRRRLLARGRAVLGRTVRRSEEGEAVYLKLTMINPLATESDVDELLDAVLAAGREEERDA